ncbi:Similar to Ttc36: Tetratricopeptide repeat protein 36 (Rattus norvegicus) [Cotesia congregata]|uniref:Similar to Ttc36: Tetratricopeptide repeat protein 36 (Rattus norvegicus) n=1 Tax=Cotesia congregata TaxID=51543 RepID=A0A8J2MR19_COTCN|nr:Similar to Ttc36: Tetratricopeptide repeat protein 36 (Rattus norvegicus) [Cotesia congregata]
MEQLSEHDKSILDIIFDPLQLMSSGQNSDEPEDEITEALKDLDQAVTLSSGRGKAGTKALCQRGLLHRLEGRKDEAKRDFEIAAKNGSAFARSQLVDLNPYAAMCNAMLKEITSKSVQL